MSHYWLAAVPPLFAVADSPKEWGIIGALFIVSVLLIKMVERFIPASKARSYQDKDRERDNKIAEYILSQDGDGMPRIWFPASITKTLESIDQGQHRHIEAMQQLLNTQRQMVELMHEIRNTCMNCQAGQKGAT